MNYISPDTQKVYTIVEKVLPHTSYEGNGVRKETFYTQYNIFDGDRKVQFAFDKDDIASAVKHYEFPGPDLSSRFD